MFRLLAMLAAVAPALLSAVIPGRQCGFFGYRMPEPTALESAVWTGAAWGVELLPVALALLALWLPRRFRLLGASASAAVLLLVALTVAIPYTTPCGPLRGEWPLALCPAVALIACLLADRKPSLPGRPSLAARERRSWLIAAAWTAVLFIALGRDVAATMPVSSEEDLGCMASLQDTWALAQMHLFTAEAVGGWVGVAAVGAALTRHPAALAAALALLIPALFQPIATLVSSAPHDCSGILELIAWPYAVAAILALAAELVPRALPHRAEP